MTTTYAIEIQTETGEWVEINRRDGAWADKMVARKQAKGLTVRKIEVVR